MILDECARGGTANHARKTLTAALTPKIVRPRQPRTPRYVKDVCCRTGVLLGKVSLVGVLPQLLAKPPDRGFESTVVGHVQRQPHPDAEARLGRLSHHREQPPLSPL